MRHASTRRWRISRGAATAALLVACAGRADPPVAQPEPVAPPAAVPAPAPGPVDPSGEVDGRTWRIERTPTLRLVVDGEPPFVAELQQDADGCYVTDAMHGAWCDAARLADSVIRFHPNVARPAP